MGLLLAGCLDGAAGSTSADVDESDIAAIVPGEEACLPAVGASCGAVDPAEPCATSVDWRLTLIVERTGCDVPGVELDEVGLPEADMALTERPAFSLGTLEPGPDVLVDPTSLTDDASGTEGATDPTLVFRAALGAFNPARCAWPFEMGWYRDTSGGTRQIMRLHGFLSADGTATGTGERRDESVAFACSSDVRIARTSTP